MKSISERQTPIQKTVMSPQNGQSPSKPIRIWKISHGTRYTNPTLSRSGPGGRDDLQTKHLVSIHRKTRKKQGKNFLFEVKPNDFFYLCYGQDVQLLGRFRGGSLLNAKSDWPRRKYDVLRLALTKKFRGVNRRSWTPSGRTTCWMVPPGDLSSFEEMILKPHFGCSLRQLKGLNASSRQPEALGIKASKRIEEQTDLELEKRAGFQTDSTIRKKVELHAMAVVRKYFIDQGFDVEDHSKNHPYDLKCSKGKNAKYVEVKGTQTGGQVVALTKNEVAFVWANSGKCVLCVVRGIQVERHAGIKATGGQLEIDDPFILEDIKLTPLTYEFKRKE
jgi:hypothetical protein